MYTLFNTLIYFSAAITISSYFLYSLLIRLGMIYTELGWTPVKTNSGMGGVSQSMSKKAGKDELDSYESLVREAGY